MICQESALQEDCSMDDKNILLSFEREQLKQGLECLLNNQKNFSFWDRFPLIPNFQEIYFWKILQLSWEAEKKNVKYFHIHDEKVMLFTDKDVPLLHYMAQVSKTWIPEAFEKGLIRVFLGREIARRLLNQNPHSEQFYRYLCRFLLINKYHIQGNPQLSPFEMKKQFEKEVREAYSKQMKTKEKFTEVRSTWETVQAVFPEFLESVRKSREFKSWKKENPAKPLRIKVRDAFPVETREQYPFSIPMFEKMYRDLKKKKY